MVYILNLYEIFDCSLTKSLIDKNDFIEISYRTRLELYDLFSVWNINKVTLILIYKQKDDKPITNIKILEKWFINPNVHQAIAIWW